MQSLVEKYRPRALADFAGLAGPVAVLSKFVAAPYSSAWLFLGPAGVGKTTMAFALAEEIAGEAHHIPSRNCDLAAVEKICGACHYYPWHGSFHVVIVDEADQMSRPAQLAFLSKLDSTDPPPNTVFIFTANATVLLERRFLSRTRILRFDLGGDVAAAVAFLDRIWRAESPAPPPDLAGLLKDSDYNLRDALMRIEVELAAPGINAPSLAAAAMTPPRPSRAPAVPIVRCACPACGATSANWQGLVAHLRIKHGLGKIERDRLFTAVA